MEGQVMKSTGSWYEVITKDKKIFLCRVRGKFRIKGIRVTNPVAVGDHVKFKLIDTNEGVIEKIFQRKNYLIRRAIKKSADGQILAANIDQAVLVATTTLPRTSTGFIDRFLVAADSFRIPSVLVFNKSDLWDDSAKNQVMELINIYESIGVDFLCTSAEKKDNIDIFRKKLDGKLSLIAGHSGVGKSSLLNLLAPHIQQKTAEISGFANKGVHTTTFAEMFDIGNNSYVIDTPGIKELGLMDIYDEELSHFFPEMRALFGKCKYHNCTHMHEPGCAVLDAVEKGEIALSRYYSYLSIMEEEETHR